MKLIELFSDKVFKLPLKKENASISATLKNRFDIYLKLLKKLDGGGKYIKRIKDHSGEIRKLCKKLIKAHESYLQGSPYNAYGHFSDGMSGLEAFLLFSIRERVKYPDVYSLFRVRESQEKYLTKKDIFHIPFEHRYKVSNQRYSINGFPCLYLGSSIYVCWEELNRPNFGDLYISKFKLTTYNPKILDLTFSAKASQSLLERFEEKNAFHEWRMYEMVDKLILFPLIMSCSIINREKNRVFKEEYIIPQLLLEWVRNKNVVNGIEYLSLSLPEYNLDQRLYKNYVFPAKQQKVKGQCDFLSSIFELTDPISWDFAKALDAFAKTSKSSSNPDFNVLNQQRSYAHTEFGVVEKIIDSFPFKKLGIT
ncbi:MAG: hypothetical protein PHU49_03595 [Syntrophorhabdaceae bacterium]|nr:hypothetical protein [Syntrophorhabdaceae bacterium]MDD5243079.1 hypothetical protein [Syntrophorhabdaceae bacterium]